MDITKIAVHHRLVLEKLTQAMFSGSAVTRDQQLFGLYREAYRLFQGQPVQSAATVLGYATNVGHGTATEGRVARAIHEMSGVFVQLAGTSVQVDVEKLQLTVGRLYATEHFSGDGASTTAIKLWPPK